MEMRFTPSGSVTVETRADGKRIIAGYGAVFYDASRAGTEYQLWPDLIERVAPTAFNRALTERQDVRGLFNHDANQVLGRSSAGTMRITVDQMGLRYEIEPPETQIGRDVSTVIGRGDVTGSSFSFTVRKQSFEDREDGTTVRTLEDVDLYDVGPVTFPAYEATTTALRSGDAADALTARDAWRAEKAVQRQREADAVAVRMRFLELDTKP
jgi:HK97 family phage prohead protease